jgi:peptidase YpeB-like protein
MKRIAITAVSVALVLAGAGTGTALAATSQSTNSTGTNALSESARSGASMMNETEIKQKLQAEGYSNVQLGKHEGDEIDVTATKNGQRVELQVDPQSGAIGQDTEKEKDDDDD